MSQPPDNKDYDADIYTSVDADVRVIKRDHTGQEVLHYYGDVIGRGEHWVCVRAVFITGADKHLGYVTLRKGDIFLEWFYADRWYNIFQVHEGTSDRIKGWYCNLTRPAVITSNQIAADDLALDLFVKPDGDMLLLDQDEYAALSLSDDERAHVQQAVETLQRMVTERQPPFDAIV